MNRQARVPTVCSDGSHGWLDGVAARVIRRAALGASGTLSGRLGEEWLAALSELRGPLRRLSFALGCCWAVLAISREHTAGSLPASFPATRDRTMTAHAYCPTPPFSRHTARGAPGSILCEINTTPLIDVMLVLLVTLIISLPIMTHAVKLDLPQAPASQSASPEVIDLDIDFDGTVAWNGTPLATMQQLESRLRTEARTNPQPEIHLRAHRRVRFDFVAKVLAAIQRNQIKKVGFVDTAAFKD